jgi:hypothetical protein
MVHHGNGQVLSIPRVLGANGRGRDRIDRARELSKMLCLSVR